MDEDLVTSVGVTWCVAQFQAGENLYFTMDLNSPSTSNKFSQSHGQPPSKKPRLSIDKHISLSGSLNKNQPSSTSTVKDLFDEIWGDDPDSTVLEKVELDETFAFSQVSILIC